MNHYGDLRSNFLAILSRTGELDRLDGAERRILERGSLEVLVAGRRAAVERKLRCCRGFFVVAALCALAGSSLLLAARLGWLSLPLAAADAGSWLAFAALAIALPTAVCILCFSCLNNARRRRELYRLLTRERWRLIDALR